MIAEHVYLSAAATRLAVLTDGADALEQAQQIAGHFAAHAAKENDVLLPALLADGSVDLGDLLDEMHHHAGHAGTQPAADETHDGDAEATVLSRLHGLVREAGAEAPSGTPEGDGGRSPGVR